MQDAPRLDTLILELVRGRNAWIALAAIGVIGCIPILNFVVFGYALEYLGKHAKTGRFDFDRPSDWVSLVRESLVVGVTFLGYCGVPWFLCKLLGQLLNRLSNYAVFPMGSLFEAAGGIAGLGLFGAAFITYIRSGNWEPLIKVQEIGRLALSMASAVWMPVVLIFGLSAITDPFSGFGLAIGIFAYCFYLGEISRRLRHA
ncbi:MAG: hypothetical protein AAGB06_05865 [Verrucomicrobiota bacterium]